jgi:hypothetical protein
MSKNKNQSVEAQDASATPATAEVAALMNVPVTTPQGEAGGAFHTVWAKKDLQGTPSRMAVKADDRVVNKGEVVVDPATNQNIHLIRVHRGKRVWYGKGLISEAAVHPASTETVEA